MQTAQQKRAPLARAQWSDAYFDLRRGSLSGSLWIGEMGDDGTGR
jgi:hypothetical protein